MPSRLDGLVNCLTGLGESPTDTRQATHRTYAWQPTTAELEQEWLQSWTAYREVSQLPWDMFREGFDLVGLDPDEFDMGEIRSHIEGDLTIQPDGSISDPKGVAYYAWQLREQGDKLGGAALFPILDDGLDPVEPLDLRRVQRVVSWEVFDRDEITPWTGSIGVNVEPEYYILSDVMAVHGDTARVLQPGDVIHRSRLIIHPGQRMSRRQMRYRQWWGASVLERNARERRAVEEGSEYARTYLDRASWLHFSMSELNEVITATDEHGNPIGEEVVRKRLKAIREYSRTMGIVVTDGGKDGYTIDQTNTNIPGRPPDKLESISESSGDIGKIVQQNLDQWGYGSVMPRSIAFGESPSGLRGGDNAGDWQMWGGRVHAEQTTWGTEVVKRMLTVEFAAREGPTGGVVPEHYEVHWRPLLRPTPVESANIRKVNAETDKILIDSKVARSSEVREQRLVNGNIDGPLRASERGDGDDDSDDDAKATEPVSPATLMQAGSNVAKGELAPTYLREAFRLLDPEIYTEEAARRLEVASQGVDPDAPPPAPDEVQDEDEEPDPIAELMAKIPSDLMTLGELVDAIKSETGLTLSTRKIAAMVKRHEIRHHKVGSSRGYSRSAVLRALAKDNGIDPDPELVED